MSCDAAISVFQPSPLLPSENVLVGSKREDQKSKGREGLKFHGKVLVKVPGSGILTDKSVIGFLLSSPG